MKTSELIESVMEIEGINDYRQSEEMVCFSQELLLDLFYEYARTPLKERKDEDGY